MRIVLLATLLLLPFLSDPALALTDVQKCSSFKWKVAGGHAECLLKEDAKAIKTGKEPDYSSCERKLTIKYTRAELKWACDVEGEIENVSNLLSTCTEGVRNTTTSNALSVVGVSPGWTCTGPAPDNCEPICGDSLTVGTEFCDDGNTTGSDGCSADCLSGCGDGLFEPAEGEECDDGNLVDGDECTAACKFPVTCAAGAAWEEHGDGTATHCSTGLMWELKTDDGTVHDKDNVYRWSGASWESTFVFDGAIKTDFLDVLNDVAGGGVNGFAGYTDWRIPRSGTGPCSENAGPLDELFSIYQSDCESPPCSEIPGFIGNSATDLGGTFEGSALYWSATTTCYSERDLYCVDFSRTGQSSGRCSYGKVGSFRARAVRGGTCVSDQWYTCP